jgi:hypothetical protein
MHNVGARRPEPWNNFRRLRRDVEIEQDCDRPRRARTADPSVHHVLMRRLFIHG